MDKRKKIILKAIVDDYIEKAEPVGSKQLAARHDMSISPATLRNEMSALESMGYLEQPHTSAGRVPTNKGYRMYIDELMNLKQLSSDEKQAADRLIMDGIKELDRLLGEAGTLVSRLTRYAAFSAPPNPAKIVFQRFEILLADAKAIVVIMILEGGIVKNKWIRLYRTIREEHVRRLSDSLNAVFSGRSNISDRLIDRCAAMAGKTAEFLPPIIDFIREVTRSLEKIDVTLSGESHLLSNPEFKDVHKAQRTLEHLHERREALAQFVRQKPSLGVQIYVGPEAVAKELADTSVVMASYDIGDDMKGLIGVIGPTRMDYGKLSAHLNYIASRFARLLQQDEREDDET